MHEALRTLDEMRPLRNPVLIAAFSGLNDHGGAAMATIDHLAEAWGARDLAEIEPEPFFDFTVQRPTVRVDGDQRRIDWPIPRFRVASPEGSDRDFVLLSSAEPHLRWRTFTEIIAEVMEATGVTTSITIAAQAAATPHTRPLPVTLSASHDDFEQQFGLEVPESRYEGPTGIVGVLNLSHRSRGWRNASLWAQAPHYLTTGPNPGAITALVEILDRGFGTQTSLASVEAQAADFEEEVRRALAESSEAADYIKNLEEQYDENESRRPAPPDEGGAALPSAEDLLSDLEGFLRDQRDDA
ncbi:MAG: PAC2 family protein [Chloroflexi bacterium]|nr:PAC2 family protein [Chloroflexota bacterium]